MQKVLYDLIRKIWKAQKKSELNIEPSLHEGENTNFQNKMMIDLSLGKQLRRQITFSKEMPEFIHCLWSIRWKKASWKIRQIDSMIQLLCFFKKSMKR